MECRFLSSRTMDFPGKYHRQQYEGKLEVRIFTLLSNKTMIFHRLRIYRSMISYFIIELFSHKRAAESVNK